MPPEPRIKICCIQNLAEARAAVEAGAHAIGLVAAMPSGPGPIPDRDIATIAAGAPTGVERVLLSARTAAVAIADHVRNCGVDTVQLVDRVAPAELAKLRELLPHTRLMQVIHVEDGAAVDEALAVASLVDAVLLDSGSPAAAPRVLGGTGRVHDWTLSRRIVERAPVPVWLAGGLDPDNVAEAVAAVGPHGVDVCTGVRREGLLDRELLRRFCRAARSA